MGRKRRKRFDDTKLYWGVTGAALLSVPYLVFVGVRRLDVLWYPRSYDDASIVLMDALCLAALGLWSITGYGLPSERKPEDAGAGSPRVAGRLRLWAGVCLLSVALVLGVASGLMIFGRHRGVRSNFDPFTWGFVLCLGVYMLVGVVCLVTGVNMNSRLMRFLYGASRTPGQVLRDLLFGKRRGNRH